jgi:MoaD family protein
MTVVTIEYLLKFREITGRDREVMIVEDNATIKDILKRLESRYGEKFMKEFTNPSGDAIAGNVLILLNGRTIRIPEDLNTSVINDDVITITHVVEGG